MHHKIQRHTASQLGLVLTAIALFFLTGCGGGGKGAGTTTGGTTGGVATAGLANGIVTTVAGSAALWGGSVDGIGTAARFNSPWGITADAAGNLYVADRSNVTIRKITPAGVVSTLAGSAGMWGSADGTGTAARFGLPTDIIADSAGNLYVADTGNHNIRKITSAGVVSTVAGSAGVWGSVDGTGTAALFNAPSGITLDTAGNLFVSDSGNSTIRKITPAGVVSTVAGSAGMWGSADGTGMAARFDVPMGITADAAGNLFVTDHANHTIRKITQAGVVTTVAGSAGMVGSMDGAGGQFSAPVGITADAAGNLYVTDYANQTIRKITPAGVVSTVAGKVGAWGSIDGIGAAAGFSYPAGITTDAVGNLYVTDSASHTIRKIQ